MSRVTLNQISSTMIPQSLGCCNDDLNTIALYLNSAIPNLVQAGGETGWAFGWKRVIFDVDPDDPYIVCPREIIRLVNADIRKTPVRISNEWYEFLEGGPGLQSLCDCGVDQCLCGRFGIYDRGTVPTPVELDDENQKLRVYYTDVRDIGRRILFSGALDQNGNRIYSQDGNLPVDGFYLTLANPFVTSSYIVTGFNAIQKDATFGDVLLMQVDNDTGDEVQLARFAPDEINPSYRKYFIQKLPIPCDGETTVQVTALAKLEFIPLVRGTDFLLIGNIEALRLECESIKYSRMDIPSMQVLAIKKHNDAIKKLQEEQRHVYGEQRPAITQPLSGLIGIECQRIGTMT